MNCNFQIPANEAGCILHLHYPIIPFSARYIIYIKKNCFALGLQNRCFIFGVFGKLSIKP
ncbi:hypothetical protein DRQ07_07420 [candidate division KSB1 bacterium]|nr:MAG: hypothetical protein DRQ07_07420 [candidate division KSB1 bacterium]